MRARLPSSYKDAKYLLRIRLRQRQTFANKVSEQSQNGVIQTLLRVVLPACSEFPHSTVTDLAKFRGLSTSVPLANAV